MANRVTQEERGRIVARAKQLVTENGEIVSVISDALVAEFGISRDRARSAAAKAIRVLRGEAIRRAGPPLGSRNAAKPKPIQRIVYHNARLPRWLCEWLDSQPDRGQMIEDALIEKFNLQPPRTAT